MEKASVKKSVTGFSRLEYIFGIASVPGIIGKFCDQPVFRTEEAHRVVKEVAIGGIEAERRHYARTRVDVSRLGYRPGERDFEGYGATKLMTITKTAISGLSKWGLIERISSDEFRPLGTFRRIGELLRQDKVYEAKVLLYHHIIKKEDPFRPRRFLLGLRDYEVREISFKKPFGMKMSLEENGGIAYTDDAFIDHLHTNSWAITVMSDWGAFFDLVDWFPETFVINGKKRHCRMLVLTKRMSSLQELLDVHDFTGRSTITDFDVLVRRFSEEHDLNAYASKSILACAENIELLRVDNGKVKCGELPERNEIISKVLKEKGLIVLDGDEHRGVILRASSVLKEDPSQVYFLMDPTVTLETFRHALYASYFKATGGKTYEDAWIHTVRKLTCKSLHINSSEFDRLLTELYIKIGAPYIELAKVSLREPPDFKPFIYMKSRYHMIKVRKK